MTVTKLGQGLLTWPRSERVSDRYGTVGVNTARWYECGVSDLDPAIADQLVGRVGRLKVTIITPQESSHIGDLFRGLRQRSLPIHGKTYDLSTEPGKFFTYKVGETDVYVGIYPPVARDTDWLVPELLYDLHESVVILEFHE